MQQFINLQTLISNDRLANIIKYSEMVRCLEGDFFEFGVFRGGSLELLANLHPERSIIGIDSFCGLPAPGEYDTHDKGDFSEVDFGAIKGYFSTMHRNVTLLRGFSPKVFDKIHKFKMTSFVHVDVDLYNSVYHACDFFYPRLVDGGVMLFDDYGFESTPGCKSYLDEFSKIITPAYQGELEYYPGHSNKQYLIVK